MTLHEPLDLERLPEICDLSIHAALLTVNRSHVRVAQSDSRFDKRIKHPLQIEGRAADHFEHVGGGGLLLKRFAQLVEQACVLDGDNGLTGEVFDQLDLFVDERPYLLPVDTYDTNQIVLLEQRDDEEGSDFTRFPPGDHERIATCVCFQLPNILDMRDLLSADDSCETSTRIWSNGAPLNKRFKAWRHVYVRNFAKQTVLIQEQVAKPGLTNP